MRLLPETDVLALHHRRLDPRQQHDGTQAEFVRTPYADTSLYPIPEGADEEAPVMLSDILPTAPAAFATRTFRDVRIPVAIRCTRSSSMEDLGLSDFAQI
jgi:threonine dehydrogenase-like Zn-dependent dehydrogenase